MRACLGLLSNLFPNVALAPPQVLCPHRLTLTRGTGRDVVRLQLLLLWGPPVAAVLGVSALWLHALAPAGAHAALLKLLMVFDLQGGRIW
jgi:hypothetical protein